VRHPAAAGQVFFAADDDDLSTRELLRRSVRALGRMVRLLSQPNRPRFPASITGRPGIYERLCGSPTFGTDKDRELLCWTPQFSVDVELARTANLFLALSR